eukprot:Skav232071  [mRNA]  locus=scaffold1176:272203:273751:- [translate_table: standard]
MLNSLVERRARPDIGNLSGEFAVHWAAKSSNVHALEAMTRGNRGLLSVRDCDGFTPLIISAQTDNAQIMEPESPAVGAQSWRPAMCKWLAGGNRCEAG